MRRDVELEATIVAKYAAVVPVLDERSRRRWAAAESLAIGYGGDALISSATGLAPATIRKGRREIARDEEAPGRLRRAGAGRPRIQQDQPGILTGLEALVDPLTRGDPTSLRWTCKSRAKLAAELTAQGWRVSSTVGRLLHGLPAAIGPQTAGRYLARTATRSSNTSMRCYSGPVFDDRAAGGLGRHQEEGVGGKLLECGPGMAANGDADGGSRA